MDALKAIPQFFFDLIGRMVPGSVVFFVLHFFLDTQWTLWRDTIVGALAFYPAENPPSTFVVLTLALAAFALGHIISPLTKRIQRLGERFPKELETPPEESANYAWLRVHSAEAGGHCAKLRAEFTMYNGLAAAFLLAAPLSYFFGSHPLIQVGSFLVLAVLMAYRGREGRKTFTDNVRDFFSAATNRDGTRVGCLV
jgi:hypothetical protein